MKKYLFIVLFFIPFWVNAQLLLKNGVNYNYESVGLNKTIIKYDEEGKIIDRKDEPESPSPSTISIKYQDNIILASVNGNKTEDSFKYYNKIKYHATHDLEREYYVFRAEPESLLLLGLPFGHQQVCIGISTDGQSLILMTLEGDGFSLLEYDDYSFLPDKNITKEVRLFELQIENRKDYDKCYTLMREHQNLYKKLQYDPIVFIDGSKHKLTTIHLDNKRKIILENNEFLTDFAIESYGYNLFDGAVDDHFHEILAYEIGNFDGITVWKSNDSLYFEVHLGDYNPKKIKKQVYGFFGPESNVSISNISSGGVMEIENSFAKVVVDSNNNNIRFYDYQTNKCLILGFPSNNELSKITKDNRFGYDGYKFFDDFQTIMDNIIYRGSCIHWKKGADIINKAERERIKVDIYVEPLILEDYKLLDEEINELKNKINKINIDEFIKLDKKKNQSNPPKFGL